jgi:hypothetical protein
MQTALCRSLSIIMGLKILWPGAQRVMEDTQCARITICNVNTNSAHQRTNLLYQGRQLLILCGRFSGSWKFQVRWRFLFGMPYMVFSPKCNLANRHIGTSSECPICNIGPEDIMHLLFQCLLARNMWSSLGLHEIIDEVARVDRAGSAVLEALLWCQSNHLQGFDELGLKEVISTTCWYLWWIRRRQTHNEDVPPLVQCKMSILAIVSNATKTSKPRETRKWLGDGLLRDK